MQIRLVLAPIRSRQSACCCVHWLGQLGMYEERQAGPRDMWQRRAELLLVDHGEAVDAGMNEEALESWHACGGEPFNVLLVVAHHTAPGHPVHAALTACGMALCFECSHGGRRRQAIERHIYKQRVSASRSGARCRTESFPFRASGFVNVYVRVHQA